MVRIVISLDAADMAWLEEKSRSERVPMTELVRVAIRRYRRTESAATPPGLDALLSATRGAWAAGDGFAYQRRVRAGWTGH